MKKSIVILLFASTTIFAADTGTLLLQGTVPERISIVVADETIASSLPLDTSQTQKKVATVTSKSNTPSGFSVSVSSANLGYLVHETDSNYKVQYQLYYGSDEVDVANGEDYDDSTAGPTTSVKDISVSYTGIDFESYQQGKYADTVTFTISAL